MYEEEKDEINEKEQLSKQADPTDPESVNDPGSPVRSDGTPETEANPEPEHEDTNTDKE